MKKAESDYLHNSRMQPVYDWNNRVVLITEDEEVNFFYLKTLLQKADAKVIRA